jgi:predicted aspartyl protease
VHGSIGSFENRNLVIDTGAYPSIIDRAVAKKLHLTGPAEELDAVTRTLKRPAVMVPSFDVGPIHADGVRSLVEDLSAASQRFGVRIDALIGLDVLAHSSFRIDYGARRMYFGPVEPLPSSAPFQIIDAKLCVDLYAGTRSVRLLVDTGAEKLLLFGSRVPGLAAPTAPTQEFTNVSGNFRLREIRFERLQLGDTNLAGEPIYVSDAANLPPYVFDGFLATAQFRQIAFDFERQEFSWMTNDERRDQVRVATNSSKPVPATPTAVPSMDAAIEETSSPSSTPGLCGDPEARGVTCALRFSLRP